ncbi:MULTISPECIES: TRAP transporter fused permease subunit [unclassified Halomonas]|uniref:TRAP transporter permease n=1 Tax=unclassified Halomonas TaxID=2609666 RepID=UPI00288868AD|nr:MULTISPECIES: TRAP transporter fused permease subunit [unclassified Halomonas]MDT0502517.1 TRAP transporter fused permease subunit [Halomonas sp. PAR7]MDT0512749.1 TRAP transporter fused permease subunit [Halomonas sp. LES1]
MTATHPNRFFQLARWLRQALFLLFALTLVAGALYTARFGIYNETLARVGGLGLGILLLLTRPSTTKHLARLLLDLALTAVFVAALVRYAMIANSLEFGLYFLVPVDVVLGVGALVVVLEMTRRAVGLPLVLVCLVAIVYALFGEYAGGMLGHAGVGVDSLMLTLWYSFDGVFGRPLAVVVGTIIVFIIFGTLLEALGAGDVLLKLAMRGLGWLRGGAAHAAVLASALFGSVSGSAVANVVGTGVVTIPMIKRTGFTGRFAGAVEAAASSGGQIMPPIMGAVAFIMADLTGIPYLYICLAALIPALLYYGSLFACISVEAKRQGIERPDRSLLPRMVARDWLMLSVFLVPLGMIVAMLILGSSPAMAGFWAIVAALVLGFALNRQARSLTALRAAVVGAANASAQVLVAVAAVGIVVGVMNLTGLGLRFASAAQALSDGSLLMSLIVMAMACLMLGMGMPTVPAYLIIILVMGPAVEALGVPTVAAHMFVVYFAVMSAITPPVALAGYAAASIADANPMGISVSALRLALMGFLVPFAFVYSPSLLLIADFSVVEFTWALLRLAAAIWMLALFAGRGGRWAVAGMVGAILLVLPGLLLQLAVLAMAVMAELLHRLGKRDPTKQTTTLGP